MYEKLIENYLRTMTKEDVKSYTSKEGINLDDNEVNIIYEFINKYYKELLMEDGLTTLKKLKSYLSIPLYEAIEKKYLSTKNKFF